MTFYEWLGFHCEPHAGELHVKPHIGVGGGGGGVGESEGGNECGCMIKWM